LLPISDNRIAIESSLLLATLTCDEIIVVCNGHIIPNILQCRGWDNVKYIYQPVATGVCDAIARGCCGANYDDCVILFGDNVYGHTEGSIHDLSSNGCMVATVRKTDLPGLDGWNEKDDLWVSREENPQFKLAGWAYLMRKYGMLAHGGLSLVEYFNEVGVRPIATDREDWYDIGTPANYEVYVRSKMKCT
jgi:hypothetical protein